MPVIAIPALIRNLTDDKDSVTVEGATIREVLNNLENQYPGTKAKLCDGDRIHPSIGVYINGVLTRVAMHDRVDADAELHFLPAISGGVSSDAHISVIQSIKTNVGAGFPRPHITELIT